ncbi:MAG: helix-turn-helix transcriptional regulator [Candidatus Vecturithrix sp.]|jgi:transcriptional regulator with XRE-family HTH domain|nr:helix-turn-helix transcriptional regulator [Candidatus Vecturithrix sp.]
MKENSKNLLKEIEEIFSEEPSSNQKAWGIINDFYHFILSYMEKEGISKSDLAKKLGRSRSAISQMFSKNPNLTVKKMVEIADAVGLDVSIVPTELKQEFKKKIEESYIVVVASAGSYRQDHFEKNNNAIALQNGFFNWVAQYKVSKFKAKESLC